MLQLEFIRENQEKVIRGLEKKYFKNPSIKIEEVLRLDESRRNTQRTSDLTLAESKQIAKQIGGFMKQGKKAEAEQLKTKTASLKVRAKELQDELRKINEKLQQALYEIPNIPHERVPTGRAENDNQVIKVVGEIPELQQDALPHWELIKKYDIIDFDLGNKVTGAGFPFYKGKGAKLQRALINFFLEEAEKAGYLEVQPPILINEASGYGTGQLPDKEGQMYEATQDQLYLIPTAEVPITNMYRNEIVHAKELPIKNVGYTPCFRREAGSWGAHVRGLNRLHQFDKVEIVQIVHPEKSYDTHQEMSEYIQSLLQKLDLPYRVLNLCAGDISFNASLCYDMEVFSVAQKRWLEVSSVSNFETYQSNRLKLRFRDEENNKRLAHTLNGSALALPRIVAAILENNQTPEGIKIPQCLRSFTGFEWIQ